ncbi:MAG: DEAD/DEAH box helicase [Candidatus Cyclobacteriaceae bacterium M3_2C_046]
MNHIKTSKNRNQSSFKKNKPDYNSSGRNRKTSKKVSNLDPDSLIKRAIQEIPSVYLAKNSFAELPVQSALKANLLGKGFDKPTQIQEETLEYLKAGRDLLGIAHTGTGKTAAFLIPIIDRLLGSADPFQTLVVVPTRELALQVEQEFKSLSRGLGLYSAVFIGGTKLDRDLQQLRRPQHLIIGTPGRLLDLAQRRALKLKDISVLILDEFDRMLDMGFVNDIKKIVQAMVQRQQTMLFSATIDPTQKELIRQLLKNPVQVKVSQGTPNNDQIEQDIIRVPLGTDKFDLLLDMMNDKDFEKVLIFAETKRLVDKVSKRLARSGIMVDLIHGNKSQNYRNKALDKFKRGNVQVLVATDVAARGIDVADITHVINYQLPLNLESYTHRIGRTGRAGKTGKAFTFVD